MATALRECGVLRWHIWLDGQVLFHSIDTRHGYGRMVRDMESLGSIDPEWDARIAELLESDPTTDHLLDLVWMMDGDRQGP